MEYRIRKIDRRQIVTTPLHSAATVELCRKLLKDGACVNARDIDGRTPLHHAILHRRGVEVVRELLRWGACGNACDFFKCTPLTIAIQLLGKDVVEIVRALLQHGANPNVHDYQGFSALTLAVYKRDLRLIREMLEWGADINFRNRAPIHCFLMFLTPLTEAVNGDEECAKLLIKMTVIKHFDNHKQIIDLYRFRKNSNFPKLSSFLEKCSCEILQMKSYVVKDKYSLFDFVTNKPLIQ
nr:ankyrin repeat and SOCS box protein 8-like [Halyomorpha halys]